MKKPNENKNIGDIIQDQIESYEQNRKKPEKIIIKQIEGNKATIETSDQLLLEDIICIGGNIKKDAIGVLFYLNDDEMIVIT